MGAEEVTGGKTPCFMALRNPAAHEGGELGEQEALGQLAAFSILARWIEGGAKLIEEE